MTKSPRSNRKLSDRELARFLACLAGTGNFVLACLAIGRSKSGLYKRRARDPDFDAQCRDAIAQARSNLWRTGGGAGRIEDEKSATVLGTYAGRPQLRRAVPGTLTRAGREQFLLILAATGNLRFAAHGVGLAPSSIHARRRRDPAFAAELEAALDTARAALEMRLIEASGVFADSPSPSGEGAGGGAVENSRGSGRTSAPAQESVRPELVEGSGRTSAPAQESVRPEPVEGSGRTSAPAQESVRPEPVEGSGRTSARAIFSLTASEALHFLTLHQRKRR